MDGLIVLVLIGWLLTKMNPRKQKSKKKVTFGPKQRVAQRRSERLDQVQVNLEKSKTLIAQEEQIAAPAYAGEGEALPMKASAEESFRGSLQANTQEGECICDPELEHERTVEPAAESVYANEIGKQPLLDFSAKGILQGVVMNEILTRPAQRPGRYGYKG